MWNSIWQCTPAVFWRSTEKNYDPDRAFGTTSGAPSQPLVARQQHAAEAAADEEDSEATLQKLQTTLSNTQGQIAYWQTKELPKMQQELERLAREALTDPRKKAAGMALMKRRKLLESKISKYEGMASVLEERMEGMRQTRDTVEMAAAMKLANQEQRRASQALDVDGVQTAMEEQGRYQEDLQVVQNIMARPSEGSVPIADSELEDDFSQLMANTQPAAPYSSPQYATQQRSTAAAPPPPAATAVRFAVTADGGPPILGATPAAPTGSAIAKAPALKQPAYAPAPYLAGMSPNPPPSGSGASASGASRIAAPTAAAAAAAPRRPAISDAARDWDAKTGF